MKNLFFLFSLILFASCTKKIYNQHNSMNSLDWAGTYSGVLKLDNQDQKAVIILKENLTYDLTLNDIKTSGDFVWSPNGGEITILRYRNPFKLFVREDFLKMVDKKGRDIKGGTYTLQKRDDMAITEKYWKLVELNGKPVDVKENMREPHLILKSDKRVNGNGGCNGFFGEYELDEKTTRIRFSKIGATLMACLDSGIEDEFFKTLNDVDNFSTDGDNLSLNKARMAPIARFKVVYLK